jgi:hypothetical protein
MINKKEKQSERNEINFLNNENENNNNNKKKK